MSKSLVARSITTCPFAGAVQRYHTDAPAVLPATVPASPVWSVASTFVSPRRVTLAPVRTMALAKLSFAGAAVSESPARMPPSAALVQTTAASSETPIHRFICMKCFPTPLLNDHRSRPDPRTVAPLLHFRYRGFAL